jgi:hypothetical protein
MDDREKCGLTVVWPRLLEDFGREVERRLAREIATTEDTIRYYFYLRLMAAGIQPEAMILERPHPDSRLRKKEIDLSVVSPEGVWDFEVKYHRPIPSGRNRPFTQMRGQVVSDLFKLALSDGQQRYLLYLADPEITAHWERQMETLMQANRVSPMLLTREWLAGQPKTLKSTVRGGIGFLPEDVVPSVWVQASWSGSHLMIWLFGAENTIPTGRSDNTNQEAPTMA